MSTNRRRSERTLIPIDGWTAADHRLRCISELQRQIAEQTAQANRAIEHVKEALASAVGEIDEQIWLEVESLQAFAVQQKKDFGESRSRKLDFGTLGWRKSTKIVTGKATLGLIKTRLPATLREQCIITKEQVSKDGLARLTDGQLGEVGARRRITDVFFAEPYGGSGGQGLRR